MKITSNSHIQQRNDNNLYSLLGTLSAFAGTVFAVISMPDDPQPQGAMFWPTLYLALGLLAVPILRVRRSISSVLRTEHLIMVGLVYWILSDPLQSAYPLFDVTYDSLGWALTAVGTMAIGIWIGTAGKGWRPPKLILQTARLPIDDSKLFLAVWITFFLGMFHYAFSSGFDLSEMIGGLVSSRFNAPWTRSGDLGDWYAFSEHLVYFGYVLPSLTVLLAQRRGWAQPRVIISAIFSLIILIFLAQSGGRRLVGFAIGAAALVWMLMQKRIKPKLVIGTVIVVIVLLTAMQVMLEYRRTGFEGWLEGKGHDTARTYYHVDDNFLRLSQSMATFPDSHPYVGLRPAIYALVRPIPRVFWPGKPSDPGYNLSELFGGGGASLSQSVVGEFYTMDGILAVFLGGLFFGRVACMWNKILDVPGENKETYLVWSLGAMSIFIAIRSLQELVIMAYALLGWLLVTRMLVSRQKNRKIILEKHT